MIMMFASTLSIALIVVLASAFPSNLDTRAAQCDSVEKGYQCRPETSHFWGQYSPFFSVPSSISANAPPLCEVTFAQVLSRHGARDPTASKTKSYNATIQKIQSKATSYGPGYEFIKSYQYTLGADQLTVFGQQEMVNSGINFFKRYPILSSLFTPFVRSSGEARVVESAQNWTQGFHSAKQSSVLTFGRGDPSYPYPIVVIPETAGSNNTLNHDLCTSFENGSYSTVASTAQAKWSSIFIPAIQSRVNNNLPGANLSATETIYLMDLCPFNTVAETTGSPLSPFCALFTTSEWHQYAYYETLNKFYGFSFGNPLGPTQGVGWTNELIARLTDKPVVDHTSTNSTLDSNPSTFPLGKKLYADFSHDNDITGILSALGVYNSSATGILPTDHVIEAENAGGYSAAWTVPFAARVYVEKLACLGEREEKVRIVVNDRVVSTSACRADQSGACKLSEFVEGLGFARSGGKWAECFS